MMTLQIKANLMDKLVATGLADLPGAAICSGDHTLRKGKYLFFGANPGGLENETETVSQHLKRKPETFNEYCDGVWAPNGIKRPRGAAPLQKRLQYLFASLAQNTRNICATNLVLVRSRNIDSLFERYDSLANKCWPFHRELFERVDPEVVLLMGNDTFNFIYSKLTNASQIKFVPSGHGDWMCRSVEGTLEGKRRKIVCLPHLSRYNIKSHPEVIEWIKSLTTGHLN